MYLERRKKKQTRDDKHKGKESTNPKSCTTEQLGFANSAEKRTISPIKTWYQVSMNKPRHTRK